MSLDRLLDVYRARLLAEGDRTADQVDLLVQAYAEDQGLDDEDGRAELGARAAQAVTRGAARASVHGQQFLATYATVALRRVVLPAGEPPTRRADPARVAGVLARAVAVETVPDGIRIETDDGIVTRTRGALTITPTAAQRAEAVESSQQRIKEDQVRRIIARRQARKIAQAEVADTGRRALGDAMEATPGVEGWTRATSSSSCETCQALADGTVLPPTTQMVTHPDCDCVQRPVTTTGGTR